MKIGLDKEEYYLFVREALKGSVVVGGICPIGCIFCACRSSYKALGRRNWIKFISTKDLESVMPLVGLTYYNGEGKQYGFSFGDGNFFLSCEPFFHPQYVELLKIANEYKPDWIKYTATTGQLVDMKYVDLYYKSRLKFYISINSFDIETRKNMMKRYDYGNLLDILKERQLIYRLSIMFSGSLDVLEKDIEMIYKMELQNIDIRLWLPFVSQYSSNAAKKLYYKAKSSWKSAVEFARKNLPHNIPSITEIDSFDEVGEVKRLRSEFDNRMRKLATYIEQQGVDLKNVAFLVSSSVWNYAKRKWNHLNIFELKNVTFGESYTISAVMTKKDVFETIKRNKLRYDHYALPNEIFDEFGYDMALNHIKDYKLSLFLG